MAWALVSWCPVAKRLMSSLKSEETSQITKIKKADYFWENALLTQLMMIIISKAILEGVAFSNLAEWQ